MSPSNRNALVVGALLVASVGAYLMLARPNPRSSVSAVERADGGSLHAPPQTSLSRPPGVLKASDPNTEDAHLVPVDVVARTEDGAPAKFEIYAGDSASSYQLLAAVDGGTHTSLKVSAASLWWFARILPGGGKTQDRYEGGFLQLRSLAPGQRVELVAPRALGVLRVRARTGEGNPVAFVMLELSRAPDPATTRELTDADGVAVWDGVPNDYLSTDGLRVVEVPSGFSLLEEPQLRVTSPEGSRSASAEAEVVVDQCSGGVHVALADVRFAHVIVERRVGSDWVVETSRGYLTILPASSGTSLPPSFVDDGSPAPGDARGTGYCPGRYRFTFVQVGVGVAEAVVDILPRGTTEIERFTEVPSFRFSGRVLGPAQGRAQILDLRVVAASGQAKRFEGAVLPLGLSRGGEFSVSLPRGIERVVFEGEGAASNPYVVIPQIRRVVGEWMEVASLMPARVKGRVVDGRGQAVPGASVAATSEPIDDRGEFIESRSYAPVGRTVTRADGTWDLGPGLPGAWHFEVRPSSGPVLKRKVLAREFGVTDVGDFVIESP